MPRLDDSALRTVVFLYPSVDAAKNHARVGGTGFIIGRPAHLKKPNNKPIYVPYLVSNLHVVSNGRCAVPRFNRRDGHLGVLDLHPSDWIPHPDGADVAATCIHGLVNLNLHESSFLREEDFITKEKIAEWQVGVGDEVYMIGRFLNHQGQKLNRPAARFGSISMMTEPIWNTAFSQDEESFAVEMRSRTGFSGSPVCVYRTMATNIANHIEPGSNFWAVLGVNWGYINEKETGENTWLNGVAPSWKIKETLMTPVLERKQEEAVAHIKENLQRAAASGAVPAVELEGPTTTDANPEHREDFTSLLGAAARKQPQDD